MCLSAKCDAEKVVATVRKRAREEAETVPAIYMDALHMLATLKFQKVDILEIDISGVSFSVSYV